MLCSLDGTLRLLELQTGRPLMPVISLASMSTQCAFVSNRKQILSKCFLRDVVVESKWESGGCGNRQWSTAYMESEVVHGRAGYQLLRYIGEEWRSHFAVPSHRASSAFDPLCQWTRLLLFHVPAIVAGGQF